jgi:hypothetical protein
MLKQGSEAMTKRKKHTRDTDTGDPYDGGTEGGTPQEDLHKAFLIRTDQALQFASYFGPITKEAIATLFGNRQKP